MKVLYSSVYLDGTGYAHAAIANIRSCEAAGLDVVTRPITLGGPSDREAARCIAHLEAKDLRNVDVVIQHCLPHTFERRGGVRNIGVISWETSHFRQSAWVQHCNQMDAIWTSCLQARQAIIDSGVNVQVHIVPHACDVARPRNFQPLNIQTLNGKMVLYSIGEFIRRKNFAGLLRAYFAAFTSRDNVSLLLKTTIPGKHGQQAIAAVREVIEGVKTSAHLYNDKTLYPPVLVIANRLSTEMLDSVHDRGDVFVSLSHGESWCLPAMEAMAFGNPVIASNWGSFPDLMLGTDAAEKRFCPESQTFAHADVDTGWLVPGQMTPCFAPDGGFSDLYTGREDWFDPSLIAARDYMRMAYQIWKRSSCLSSLGDEAKKRANSFSHEMVGQEILRALEV